MAKTSKNANSIEPSSLLETIQLGQRIEFVPTIALMYHEQKTVYQTDGEAGVFTVHPVRASRGIPTIQPGRVMRPSDEQQILNLLLSRHRPLLNDILPADLLFFSTDCVVWHRPCVERIMHLRVDGSTLSSVKVRWPNLVLKATPGNLSVCALEDSQRPDRNTELFHAPLPNVYSDTRVCVGDAKLPTEIHIGNIAQWDRILFDTAFTHTNHQNTLKSASTKQKNIEHADARWWIEYAMKNGDRDFPCARLAPLRYSLGEWINQVQG